MSSPQRRRELAAERAVRDEAEAAERYRYESLTLYEKIEEASDIHDIKRVLQEIVLAMPETGDEL